MRRMKVSYCRNRTILLDRQRPRRCSSSCSATPARPCSSYPRRSASRPRRAGSASRRWKPAGVIRGYTALVDREKVGPPAVLAEVNLTRHSETSAALRGGSRGRPQIASCDATTGPADYLLTVLAPDIKHYEPFCTSVFQAARRHACAVEHRAARGEVGGALPIREPAAHPGGAPAKSRTRAAAAAASSTR